MKISEFIFISCFTFEVLGLSKADVLSWSSNPSSGKVSSGQSWVFGCEVPSASSVVWYKTIGKLTAKVGYNVFLNDKEFISGGHFILNKEAGINATTYSLILTGAKSEDSGVYRCESSKSKISSTFIVCDDISESYCDCMVEQGWANPTCFSTFQEDASGTVDEYKSTLIGLLIALGIFSLYVIVIIIMYGRDLFEILRRRKKDNNAMKKKGVKLNIRNGAGKILNLDGYSDKATMDPIGSFIPESQSESSGYCGSQASSAVSDLKKIKTPESTYHDMEQHSISNVAFESDMVARDIIEVHSCEKGPKWTSSKFSNGQKVQTLSDSLSVTRPHFCLEYDGTNV